MREFFRGRLACFDRWVAALQHEQRRDALDTGKRIDEVEASTLRTAKVVQSLAKQVDTLQGDVMETIRSERQVGDVKPSFA